LRELRETRRRFLEILTLIDGEEPRKHISPGHQILRYNGVFFE
jgi:hypothetical protein